MLAETKNNPFYDLLEPVPFCSCKGSDGASFPCITSITSRG